jgi:5-methylcytosine-specific restriction enzyme A
MARQRSAMRIGRAPNRIAPAPLRTKAAPKMAAAFYQSAEWKALKAMRRRDPDYAMARKRCKPGEWLVLDHVIEIKDGGAPLDPANTQWLTNSEHQAKTALRKRQRSGMEPGSGSHLRG